MIRTSIRRLAGGTNRELSARDPRSGRRASDARKTVNAEYGRLGGVYARRTILSYMGANLYNVAVCGYSRVRRSSYSAVGVGYTTSPSGGSAL